MGVTVPAGLSVEGSLFWFTVGSEVPLLVEVLVAGAVDTQSTVMLAPPLKVADLDAVTVCVVGPLDIGTAASNSV